MQTKKTNIRLKYFTCNEGGQHEGESLNYVCIDKQCKKVGLLCSICKLDHADHVIRPLKFFLTELKTHNQKPMQNSDGFQKQLEQLENDYKSIMFELRTIVEQLAEEFRKVEVHIHEQFSKMKVQLLERVQINMKFNEFIKEAIRNQVQSRQAFAADINRIASMVSINEENQINFETNLESVVDKFRLFRLTSANKFKNITDFLSKQSLIVNLDQLKMHQVDSQSLKPKKELKKLIYHFAPNFKASSIFLSNANLQAKQTKSGEGRFVFVNSGIGVDQQKITFKITKLKNWIGIGIGLRDKIKGISYRFEYNQLGHGSYLISSNGYSWSHSQKQDNIVVVSFKFKEGDIVQVEYYGSQLIFKNLTTNINHKLKTAWKQNQKNVCFCANLCSEDDEIQILNE